MQNRSLKARGYDAPYLAASATITTAVLFGGGAAAMGLAQATIVIVGLLAGFVQLFARHGLQDIQLPWLVIAVMLLLIVFPLLQLIPLPPEIWRSLPGRGAETTIIELAGGEKLARPLALDPNTNLQLFATLVMLTAFAINVARLDAANINRLLRIVLALALVQFLIGAVQFSTGGTALDIFDNSHKGWLLGTFANRNHAGLFFACAILLTAALYDGRSTVKGGAVSAFERLALLALVSLWLIGAIGTGSRTAFVLSLLATAIAAFVALRGVRVPKWAWLGGTVMLATVVAAVMSSGRVERLVNRYETVGEDQRWSMWNNSYKIIADYMPWGSGFGSFSYVYNKYEPITEVIPTYTNNAHNDYLELIIEAGLPGFTLLGLVVLLSLVGVVRGIRSPDTQIARHALVAGGIILLFLCHSVVDYPIRRTAMALILFLALGLLLRQFSRATPQS